MLREVRRVEQQRLIELTNEVLDKLDRQLFTAAHPIGGDNLCHIARASEHRQQRREGARQSRIGSQTLTVAHQPEFIAVVLNRRYFQGSKFWSHNRKG